MKKLFAVLLAVAMLLSLGVTAFAANEKITVTNPPIGVRYRAIKVFDVVGTPDALTGETKLDYTIKNDSPFYNAVNGYAGIKLIQDATDSTKYHVEKLVSFSAADFATTLAAVTVSDATFYSYDTGIYTADGYSKSGDIEIPVPSTGYYLIQSASGIAYDATDVEAEGAEPGSAKGTDGVDGTYSNPFSTGALQATAALTTVLTGQTVQIQNKNDMPLDKTVKKDGAEVEDEGVQVGDTLNYEIKTKVPELDPNQQTYIFKITDAMTDGLTFGNKLTIKVGSDTYVITFTPKKVGTETTTNTDKITVMKGETDVTSYFKLITDPGAELTGNQVRFDKNGLTFELSLDVSSGTGTETAFAGSFRYYHGQVLTIEYDAVVNENAIAEVLENKAVLAYGEDNEHLTIKDDSTKNYLSKIVIDKFAEGNNTQKLQGAEFALYRRNPTEGDKDAYGNQKYKREYYALTVTKLATPAQGTEGQEGYVAAVAESVEYTFAEPKFTIDSDGNQTLDTAEIAAKTFWDATKPGLKDGYAFKVQWVAEDELKDSAGTAVTDPAKAANISKVVTDNNGAAIFGYLPDSTVAQNTVGADVQTDGKYYLLETKAPVDYTKLLNPVEIVVDGSASTEPSMTAEQQDLILTNIANVSNTPGSTLPSTGGVGATLLTIGGIALMLAAGAFLVLRRRKEQE